MYLLSHFCTCLGLPGQPDPLSTALGYVQVTDAQSEESAWMVVIAERAFDRYLAHIEAEMLRLRDEAEATERVS